jgi:hypothetical protein
MPEPLIPTVYRIKGVQRSIYLKKTRKKINADINAALNVARRLGHRVRISRKIEIYYITHNGVKPLIPLQGASTRDSSIETPPFKARGCYRG